MNHVLIVEDHEADRKLLKMRLERNGYRVTAAGDGLGALAAARRDPPDAIVSDVLMPKMDGFALCRAWMQDAALRAIPFIFYSATYARAEDEHFAMSLGAVRYLTKPLDEAVFLEELRAVLQEWAEHAASAPAAPLNDAAYYAMHESALARKLEDKIAQLETANHQVQESEARYRQLFEANPIPMWVFDPETLAFLAVNDAAVAHYGWSREEFLAMTLADIRSAETLPALLTHLATDNEKRIRSVASSQHRKKDGTLIDVEISSHVVDFSGQRARIASAYDITDRKLAAEGLKTRDAYLTAIIENQPGLIWLKDVKGRFLAINHAFADSCGREIQDVLGKTDLDIWPREMAEKYIADDGNVMQAGQPIVVEEMIDDKNERKWFETFKTPIRDSHGTIIGSTGYARDITERKLSEMKLRATEEQFRGLVEQSIAGIYIVQDGKFAYVNPRFAEIRGFASADELIGRTNLSLVAEKDRGAVTENNRRLLAGEARSINYSFTALRKDGSVIEVGVHGTRATHDGRPAIIGLMQDISEKKRAEEEILRYVEQLKIAFMSTVEVATILSEMRDPYTAGHERRVAETAVAIGAELGFDQRQLEGLRVAGHLHDIGKITIPSEILSKPGKISAIEFQLIQGHAQAGYDVLKGVEFPWPVAQVALQHHERMDGSGYPQGLKGEAILFEARIMSVADVMEAMTSHRPYRPGLGIDKALAEIERGRGSVYDPVVADACLRLFREKGYAIPA